MMCHPEATAVTSMLISFSLLDTNKLDSVVKSFISSFSTFLQIFCKLNKREKVNRLNRQRKQTNKSNKQVKQTIQTNESNKRTKKIKLTYLSKEQTKLREKCCKKNSKEWFKKRMIFFRKIIQAISLVCLLFSSFFWLNFNPMKKKLVEYRSGVNVLPWTPFRNHLSDTLWYPSYRLWLAPSQRSPFAFASGHLFLEFQRLPLRDFVLGLATSAGYRYVLSPP